MIVAFTGGLLMWETAIIVPFYLGLVEVSIKS